MSKHTPGPWSIEHDTDITGVENSPEIGCVGKVDVAHVYLRAVPGKTQANARLIAAAPELLEALLRAKRHLSVYSEEFDMAERAIAKATGATE